MNVPGGQGSGAPNDAGDSPGVRQPSDDADRAATESPRSSDDDADRIAARRRLAEQLQESLLPDITDDERPDYREHGRDDLGEWLMQNRPPHHDR